MRKIFLLLSLFLPVAAFAQTAKPPEIASTIHADKPYGDGAYTWMGITAYDASIWTDAKPWTMDVPYAFVIVYGMNFTDKELVDRSIKEMDQISPISDTEKSGDAAKLARAFTDVKSGDRITALYTPSQGAVFFHNGMHTGKLDDALARQFLSIWLSEHTSDPALRKKLLPAQ